MIVLILSFGNRGRRANWPRPEIPRVRLLDQPRRLDLVAAEPISGEFAWELWPPCWEFTDCKSEELMTWNTPA